MEATHVDGRAGVVGWMEKVKKRCSALVALVSLAAAGCAGEPGSISSDYTSVAAGESVVIGRGEVYYPESGESDVAFLSFRHDTSGKTYRARYDPSHREPLYFYMRLEPGSYSVIGWDNMNLRGAVNGRFDATAGQFVYIGNLRFTARSRGRLLLWNDPSDLSVMDDYEEAVKTFHENYPQIKQDVVKSLIRLQGQSGRSVR